jgi:hypothetical protein
MGGFTYEKYLKLNKLFSDIGETELSFTKETIKEYLDTLEEGEGKDSTLIDFLKKEVAKE